MTWLEDASRVDEAVYAAIARTPTPALDRAMSKLSRTADYSRLSLTAAAGLAIFGGRRGRRAAISGLAALGATATIVNVAVKPLSNRRRPDRAGQGVPEARHIPMPVSQSFPSGHTAAAVAFSTGVGQVLPPASIPLHLLAAVVGYSRVHTGVHYPGDVILGALIGGGIARVTVHILGRRSV